MPTTFFIDPPDKSISIAQGSSTGSHVVNVPDVTNDRSLGYRLYAADETNSLSPAIFLASRIKHARHWKADDAIRNIIVHAITPSPQVDASPDSGLVCVSLNDEDVLLTEIDYLKFRILNNKYKCELINTNVESGLADAAFERVAVELCKVNFLDAAIEITPNNAVKFTLSFDDEKLLMVSKSFMEDQNPDEANNIVFSIFIKRRLIVSDVAEIKEFVKALTEYLSL